MEWVFSQGLSHGGLLFSLSFLGLCAALVFFVNAIGQITLLKTNDTWQWRKPSVHDLAKGTIMQRLLHITHCCRKDQALISTIHSAKGLERPVILLAELERRFSSESQRQELEKYLYIACSRVQSHLIILLTKPLPRFLRDLFAQ